jgi:hypothetical protein
MNWLIDFFRWVIRPFVSIYYALAGPRWFHSLPPEPDPVQQSKDILESEQAALEEERAAAKTRHVTVRYYSRMNPGRVYPFLVAVTKRAVKAVSGEAFDQRAGKFESTINAVVEVEPILPGCDCYPPKQTMRVGKDDVRLTFTIVPKVIGDLLAARVVVRHKNRELTEIPLDVRVVGKTATLLLTLATLFLPFITATLRHLKVDYESQLKDDFGLYIAAVRLAVESISPELLAGLLLTATAVAYVWAWPRKRDVFWDLSVEQAPAKASSR